MVCADHGLPQTRFQNQSLTLQITLFWFGSETKLKVKIGTEKVHGRWVGSTCMRHACLFTECQTDVVVYMNWLSIVIFINIKVIMIILNLLYLLSTYLTGPFSSCCPQTCHLRMPLGGVECIGASSDATLWQDERNACSCLLVFPVLCCQSFQRLAWQSKDVTRRQTSKFKIEICLLFTIPRLLVWMPQ